MSFLYKADAQVLSPSEQVELAKNGDYLERLHLARRQDLCNKAASILLKDDDVRVREELAAFTNRYTVWFRAQSKNRSKRVARAQELNPYFGKQ